MTTVGAKARRFVLGSAVLATEIPILISGIHICNDRSWIVIYIIIKLSTAEMGML